MFVLFVALNSIKPNVKPKLFMLDFGDAALNAEMHVYPVLHSTSHDIDCFESILAGTYLVL